MKKYRWTWVALFAVALAVFSYGLAADRPVDVPMQVQGLADDSDPVGSPPITDDPEPVGLMYADNGRTFYFFDDGTIKETARSVMERTQNQQVYSSGTIYTDRSKYDSGFLLVRPSSPAFLGACDSTDECRQETKQACVDNGHGNGEDDPIEPEIVTYTDGTSACFAECPDGSGTIAFVICNDA